MSKNYEAAEIVELGRTEELVLGGQGQPGDQIDDTTELHVDE